MSEDTAERTKTAIEIVPLENPAFASQNEMFLAMVKDFAERIAVPSIRYESLHNYLATVVQGIYEQKRQGVADHLITYKVQLGYIDGELCGFSMFYLLTNRLPHIQTVDWAYCHTRNPKHPGKGDIRLAFRFAEEMRKYKKKWGARYISFVATNEKLNAVAKRLFKKGKPCGTYWVSEDINSSLLKS